MSRFVLAASVTLSLVITIVFACSNSHSESTTATDKATDKVADKVSESSKKETKPATKDASKSTAAVAPPLYKKCKLCHGANAKGGPLGPDLTVSTWSLDEWFVQTQKGSVRKNRPPKAKGYEKKNMTPLKVSKEEVKSVFDWVKSLKKG